ncbi:ABC transporter permease [Labrys miyagiensis]|uniref:ABC transporter permease n=1 Tax=Labrys miyagiensis TaxID=346912 RepID=A0ABQ6CA20_9HYPH|nr:ABC transporter permease [Labrys miyagiensis]GLS17131.1 ABC transporter permease [Labrys miyagiensis]
MSDVAMSPKTPTFRPGTSDAEIEAAVAKAAKARRTMVLVWQVVILVALLALWEISVRLGWMTDLALGMPSTVVVRLWEWITEGANGTPLWYHLWVTVEEATIGFIFGSIAGVLVGVALGRNAFLADIFSVYIKVFNSIPRVVLAPVFIIMFGLGLPSKIALSFVMVFFLVFQNAFQGVREADRSLIANAQILGAKPWQLTRAVIIPSAMSWIFASLHVSYSFAITGAIVGEFVGARYGIGQLIAIARGSFDGPGVAAAIIIIMLVVLAAGWIMGRVENSLAKWRPKPLSDH